jgi:alpha-1,3-mannosyltransferase
MEEVEGFLSGEWDYSKLRGQTGPLVYPAGFVYLYSALYYITDLGRNILLAQYIFLGLYLATIAVLMLIYHEAKVVSPEC